jgi:Predicted membrane protein
VSLEAIVLTGFVLMTQNRMTLQADKRAHLDLQVNMLAEQENTAMLQMLYALCRRSGVDVTLRDGQIKELLKDTDIHQIAVAVDRQVVKGDAAR